MKTMLRYRSAIVVLALTVGLAPGARALQTYGVPAIEKVTRDQEPSDAWSPGSVGLECARNEWEAFQVVIRSDAEEQVKVTFGGLTGPDGATIGPDEVRVYRVEWVDVNAPYEVDKPSENPDFQPDPLVPVRDPDESFAVHPGQNTMLWLSVHVPEGTPAGQHTGEITVRPAEGRPAELEVALQVRGFSLPRQSILQSMIGLATGNIYTAHGCESAEQREQVVRLYFDEYIRARLSPFLYAPGTMAFAPIPDAQIKWHFAKDDNDDLTGEVALDFEGFDREAERYLDDRDAFSSFNFAPYLWTKQERDGETQKVFRFADSDGTAVLGEDPPGTVNPLYDTLVVKVFRAIAAHLAEREWLDRAIYYVIDEPSDSDTPLIKHICELIREADPRIRTALTYDPANRPRLAELVDDEGKSLVSVWIPYCSRYRGAVADEQRAKGAEYWLYDVKEHSLISDSGRENRAMFWEVWDRDAKGYLYYLSTWWGRDATPWERPNFLLPQFTYKYRHGDGYFFYPPTRDRAPEQPILDYVVPTIRWELMREGAEDYDYLRMLEDLIERAEARGVGPVDEAVSALEKATTFADQVSSASNSYGIGDLQFDLKDGWSAGLEEGWLHNEGGQASDLPIRINTDLADGRYQLELSIYDDRDYRGRPYSRFEVNGESYASPGSNAKGSVSVRAGMVEVNGGVCEFTLSSVPEDYGVIVYRVGLKPTAGGAAEDLYPARSAVAEAIEALTAALGEE